MHLWFKANIVFAHFAHSCYVFLRFSLFLSGGIVLFISNDLKTGVSGPSKIFGSPSFLNYQGGGASNGGSSLGGAVILRGKFTITSIEVWSFVQPGSDALEQLSPKAHLKEQMKAEKEAKEAAAKAKAASTATATNQP